MPVGNPYAKAEVYGFQTLYREVGYYISRLEQYEKAVIFFDEAIKKTPDDKRALIGRAKARTKVIQYEGALEDVKKALSYDPDDLVVLADQARNTYLCCEFEQGLVENTRLVPKRQKPDHFTMGVMECSDAIENCLGERAGRPLRDHFKIIRDIAWKRNYAAQKPFEPKPKNFSKKKRTMIAKVLENEFKEPTLPQKIKRLSEFNSGQGSDIRDSLHSIKPDDEPIPKLSPPFPFRPLQNYTTNIENYMAEKYLDTMYLDKIFLKKLRTEPGAKSPNNEGTKKIDQLAKNCYKTVSYKQEILRTRRPFYFIKYQEARVSGALKERQKLELEHQQKTIRKEADATLSRMLEAHDRHELKVFLDLVDKLRRFCESKSKKLFPDKDVYMEQIFDKVCTAFYDMYRLNPAQSMYMGNRRIYCMLGLPLSRDPSTDSVIDQFKNVYLDYQKKIEECSERLGKATCVEEVCWYYHELSRYEYELKHYNLSRLYARKCINQAKIKNNNRWVFNSTMLMVKSNLAEHNKNDAKNDLIIAMACAKALKDQQKIAYLEKCLDIVQTVELEDLSGAKQLEKREGHIIKMMASLKMKDEIAHLFRQMAAMPASRRMTVMPGVRVTEKKGSKSLKSRTMSILPGGTTNHSERNKSSTLVDLIEFHV